jgi:hypothetical protein
MMEVIKVLVSLLQALLPLLDSNLQFLPVNPKIREDVLVLSIIAALLAGIAAYYSAKKIQPVRYFPGPFGLLLFVISLGAILALANDISLGIPTSYISAVIRAAYVLFFFSIGSTIGGFLGLA